MMKIDAQQKVYTETTCKRCSLVDRSEGAERPFPPISWGQLDLSIRHEGRAWMNSTNYSVYLCPNCIRKVLDLLGIEE